MTKTKIQVVFLYACTFIGMGIGVLVSIMNTRFLDPKSYGDVQYVINLISFFSGIFLVGYFVSGSRLLALANNPKDAERIKGGMLFILIFLSVIMMFVMVGCGIYHWYIGKNFYPLFYWVLPFCANAMILNYINTSSQGDNSIGTIGLARLLPSLCYLILGYIIYSIFGASSIKMLLLQNGVAMVILTILVIKNGFSFKELRMTLYKLHEENKQYGRQVYYGTLANVSVQYIAGISLGLFGADNANVGFYSLALTITSPLQMLPSIIGTTYFKKFATQKQISATVIKYTFGISILSLLGFVALIFPLVDFVYNDKYACVAFFSSFLAIGSTCQGLGDVFNRFLGAHGQGHMLRNSAFASGSIAFLGYTIGVKLFGIEGAIVTRILSSVTYFATIILYYTKYNSNNNTVRKC